MITKSPVSTCGAKVGLCLPRRSVAAWEASRPSTTSVASITCQARVISPGLGLYVGTDLPRRSGLVCCLSLRLGGPGPGCSGPVVGHAPTGCARSPHIDNRGYPSPTDDFKSPPWRRPPPRHGPPGPVAAPSCATATGWHWRSRRRGNPPRPHPAPGRRPRAPGSGPRPRRPTAVAGPGILRGLPLPRRRERDHRATQVVEPPRDPGRRAHDVRASRLERREASP